MTARPDELVAWQYQRPAHTITVTTDEAVADLFRNRGYEVIPLIPETALQSANARLAAITQAITDPENQPSQWGTIPLSMLPDRMDDSRDQFSEPDYQDGIARGWNNCLDKIGAPQLPNLAARLAELEAAYMEQWNFASDRLERLAAVLALADDGERFAKSFGHDGHALSHEAIRRAAAGEGDAPPIEIDTPTVASGEL